MTYEQIRYEVSDHIATLTLHRPDKLNAYTVRMMEEMIDAFDRADADDDVGAIIVTGDGRAFCAGADLEMGAKAFDAAGQPGSPIAADGTIDYSADSARDYGGRLTLRIFESLKPVIGAINGPAIGIGVTMLLPMDIRVASENAKFGFAFARRGIVPEGASMWFLPRIVGISQALDWCMSGRTFGAAEAHGGGLVCDVTAPGDLIATARAIAASYAESSAPVSVALTRQMLWRGLGMAHPMEAHRIDSRGVLARGHSADAMEGVTAFLEKREANFPDRVSIDMPDYFPWWDEPEYR
ncbi:crotonase/enoyl-CoA hydratase family protein [Stakelama tenebrarum]|uniref:Crotonase/enoyl-CoA hydratase family protein n=1 Tax=Stakelama tenebrarum TaxID=2711215 RepID=A0A6G6YAL7_9SPHN|nr:crotonase/enoyl-CoA hydratase family protein [Sphingosinithalassobacter tenebrarum]QIG81982.1 crotonase/enoyl-CoA hydratase family protein [Sphingosinithalassobacter tenebrarum]